MQGRKGGREGEREEGREGGRERGREGGREGGRKRTSSANVLSVEHTISSSLEPSSRLGWGGGRRRTGSSVPSSLCLPLVVPI